jgi:hypothetical protein
MEHELTCPYSNIKQDNSFARCTCDINSKIQVALRDFAVQSNGQPPEKIVLNQNDVERLDLFKRRSSTFLGVPVELDPSINIGEFRLVVRENRCGLSGGTGIGAGHECKCNRKANHSGTHGCECGAWWNTTSPAVWSKEVVEDNTNPALAEHMRERLKEEFGDDTHPYEAAIHTVEEMYRQTQNGIKRKVIAEVLKRLRKNRPRHTQSGWYDKGGLLSGANKFRFEDTEVSLEPTGGAERDEVYVYLDRGKPFRVNLHPDVYDDIRAEGIHSRYGERLYRSLVALVKYRPNDSGLWMQPLKK